MAELVDDLTNDQRYGVPAGIFDRGEADPATVLAVWRVRQAVGGGANRISLDRREIQLRDARTEWGEIDSAPAAVERMIRKLAGRYQKLYFCYEAVEQQHV